MGSKLSRKSRQLEEDEVKGRDGAHGACVDLPDAAEPPTPIIQWRRPAFRADSARKAALADAAKLVVREFEAREDPDVTAQQFAEAIGKLTDPDVDTARWGRRCTRGFHLDTAGAVCERWLQERVHLEGTNTMPMDVRLKLASKDESRPHLAMLVAGSGCGKTKAYHDVGLQPDGPLVVAVALSSGDVPAPVFRMLATVTECVRDADACHGGDHIEVASVCLDLVVMYLLAHTAWVARALTACRKAGVGTHDRRRTLLRTWRNGHGVSATAALFASMVSSYDPSVSMATIIRTHVQRFREAAAAFGLHGRLLLALDEIQYSMANQGSRGDSVSMFVDSHGSPVDGVGGGLFRGFALAIREISDATAETKHVGFLACGTTWGITALSYFRSISPTSNVVCAYHQFGAITPAHMVAVLKAHFEVGGVDWLAIAKHLAPLRGRARWFFGYFMSVFLKACQIGACDTPETWSNGVVAIADIAFEDAVRTMAQQMRHGLAARGTSVPVDTHGEAEVRPVHGTEPLPHVIQACIYSQMACNGNLQANSTAVHVLVEAAIMRTFGDNDVCFHDEPVVAEALRRVGVKSMASSVDHDVGFSHVEGVLVDKGIKLELYTQWAILRRCVRARSITLRAALGSLVVTNLPATVADLIVTITRSAPSNCLGATTSLAHAMEHGDTLLYGIENKFGPDIILPVQIEAQGKGIVAVQVKNTDGSDFAKAAKSIQPAFAYMNSNGFKPRGCVNKPARAAFERLFKKARLGAGMGTWVRAIMSAQSWSQDAIDIVNDYNTETEDGRKWPVVLMDLSKQTVRDSTHVDRMTPLRTTLCEVMKFDADASKSITNAMQLQWGGLKGKTLMTLKGWVATCRDRVKALSEEPSLPAHAVWKKRLSYALRQLEMSKKK